MTASPENRDPITEAMKSVLTHAIQGGRHEAIELALMLIRPLTRWGPDEHVIGLSHFVSHYGVIVALRSHPLVLWQNTIPIGVADEVVRQVLWGAGAGAGRLTTSDFVLLSDELLRLPLPWMNGREAMPIFGRPVAPRPSKRNPEPAEAFVLFAVLALHWESRRHRRDVGGLSERVMQRVIPNVRRVHSPTLREVVAVLASRRKGHKIPDITALRDVLTTPQVELIENWMLGTLSLVGSGSSHGTR